MDLRKLLDAPAPILLDGGMGTMLQDRGLALGESPELAALEHPDWLLDIHRAYIQAGAQIIFTNTFGANREKLRHTGKTVEEVVSSSVALARQAADGRALVALDVGPIGQLLEPAGSLDFEAAADIFTQTIRAGVQAGAELIVIETMTDLQECRAALLAAKEACTLPVLVMMTYEAGGRTFLGCPPAAAALTLGGMGADAIGINCSLGPREMPPLVQELTEWTNLPIMVKANAGLPDPGGAGYDISPAEFAQSMSALAQLGVKLYGGCCGTTPEYIRLMAQGLAGVEVAKRSRTIPSAVCSASRVVPIDRVRVIGERINPTGKPLMKQALLRGDVDYMLSQAIEQTGAGADILDVNVGLPGIDETEMMRRAVKALQGITDAPLQIDSTDPAVVEAALRVYCGKAIVNSINADQETMQAILPLVKRYGAAVVGLTLDEAGIPKTVDQRIALARRMLECARSFGIPREDLFIDCLTLTVSAEPDGAAQTLEGLRRIKGELGLKTVLGVSNISFGLPARAIINQNFLMMAMTCGLDLPILNPNVDTMMAAVRSYHLLMHLDPQAQEFIAAYGEQRAAPVKSESAGGRTLAQVVEGGLKGEAAQATRHLLAANQPMEIIEQVLIPALDRVGVQFETGKVFLPQLIQSAAAAQVAFAVLREEMATQSAPKDTRATIVLATVKGDIHDIGKNIVKVLLENYGYTVVDLGKDVAPELVVQAAVQHKAALVGLSALMTTTLKSMEQTIALLRQDNVPCKVMVGGAVLTADYAEKIGADFYAKDAKQGIDIAKQVIG